MKKITKILLTAGTIAGAVKMFTSKYEIKIIRKGAIKDSVLLESTTVNNFGHSDHVYYDNAYNICKIYNDYNGCPMVFEFENEYDRDEAMLRLYELFPAFYGGKASLSDIFKLFNLVIDDYKEFEDYFTCWTAEDFYKSNEENALNNIISFGKFEKSQK